MHLPAPCTRQDLARIACEAMAERGLAPEFSPAVADEVARLSAAAIDGVAGLADLRSLPWCSIDNDDSRDLDQLSVCTPQPDGTVQVRVAIADVDALVRQGSAVDAHAQRNTTSVYTSVRVFPMLPERLCTDLSSLNPGQDRLALVTAFQVEADGTVTPLGVQRAVVRNQAQLAYDAVAAWLTGAGPLPAAAAAVPGMDSQLRGQDEAAQRLRARRHAQGALEFQTFQPRVVFDGDRVVDMQLQPHNRARQLIEELMIATNTCTAQHLAAHGGASLRRVVRSPERWQRIVELARARGDPLPGRPDGPALEDFLARQRRADPLRFPDLSLVVIKLMGSGEYVVERPGNSPIGHFGLAERDYTHSTAPNRRFPDLVTGRMLKAVLAGRPAPYGGAALEALAQHCTRQEDAARKVERRMRKSEAALFLAPRIGQRFDALVTGRSEAGTWVRTLSPPAEGMLVGRVPLLRVGQAVQVTLRATNVAQGFIDFTLLHG